MSVFVQTLLCGVLLSDGDSWELPNSMDNNPRSISMRRGSADFLKQPYSPANLLKTKKLMDSGLSLESLFASAKNERGEKNRKRVLVLMTSLSLFPALCKNKLGSVLLLFPSHREEKYLVL